MADRRNTSTARGGAGEPWSAAAGSVLLTLVYLALANAQMTASLWPHAAVALSTSGWVVRTVGFVVLLVIDVVIARWLRALLSRVVPHEAARVWSVLLTLLVAVPAVVIAARAA